MNETKISLNTIVEEIMKCSYLTINREHILNQILEISGFFSREPEFFIFKLNSDVLIKSRVIIEVPFKSEIYDIPLIINFNKYFPSQPPEIFILRMDHMEINSMNNHIDVKNFQVITPYLRQWSNSSDKSIIKAIEDIYNSFLNIFPLYSKKSNAFDSFKIVNNFNQINPINNNFKVNKPENQPINNLLKPIVENNDIKEFSESQLKSILINEIKVKIESKLSSQFKILKEDNLNLNTFKAEIVSNADSLKSVINYDFSMKTELENMKKEIDNQIQKTKSSIKEMRTSVSDNFENFIVISNKKYLELISIEATIEDLVSVMKKVIEKEIVGLNEIIKIIRSLMRENFKIKFIREKFK